MYRFTDPRVAAVALCMTTFVANGVSARDLDGSYANSPLKQWFDQLASGNGLCCSFADGFSVQDVDWDTKDGRYRVRLQGEWVVVPDEAVVTEPNRLRSYGGMAVSGRERSDADSLFPAGSGGVKSIPSYFSLDPRAPPVAI
jgi:hypothetical protein